MRRTARLCARLLWVTALTSIGASASPAELLRCSDLKATIQDDCKKMVRGRFASLVWKDRSFSPSQALLGYSGPEWLVRGQAEWIRVEMQRMLFDLGGAPSRDGYDANIRITGYSERPLSLTVEVIVFDRAHKSGRVAAVATREKQLGATETALELAKRMLQAVDRELRE